MNCAGRLKLTTPPVAFMTTAAAKLYLRVDDNGEDTLIDSMVAGAVDMIEQYLNRKLLTQTWAYWLDDFPKTSKNDWWDGTRDGAINSLFGDYPSINIPMGPVSSVSAVKYYLDDDTENIFPSNNYVSDVIGSHGRVVLRVGAIWPSEILRPANGVKVEFETGYGALADVPQAIQQAVRECLAALYERRGDEELKMPMNALALCRAYRVENL
jgi:hypothetical protein